MEMGSGMTGSVYRCMSIENDNAYYAIKKIDKLKIAQHEGGIVIIYYTIKATISSRTILTLISLTSKHCKTQRNIH